MLKSTTTILTKTKISGHLSRAELLGRRPCAANLHTQKRQEIDLLEESEECSGLFCVLARWAWVSG